jgi:hypothetical protein
MENLTITSKDFDSIYKAIDVRQEKIEALKEECKTYYQDLDRLIWQCLTDYQWEPNNNEKVVRLDLEDCSAQYLWFVEKTGTDFRFRETPNTFSHGSNFYRQEAQPPDQNWSHRWIVPLPIFDMVKHIIEIDF